jgi:hypothetical protein
MCTSAGRNELASRAVRLAALVLLLVAGVTSGEARAQLPVPAATPFEMTGFIQQATLDGPDAADATADPFRGGTLTVNNHVVVIPRYTIFQMPATSLTWVELFKLAPEPWRGANQTGLALKDTPRPDYTVEVTVQGNRVQPDGRYIAGLVFVSNQSLQSHQGFISRIDYAAGELLVGGARVRLNDPIGRFGRAMSHDVRFTIDEDNPTIKTETGYPMCLPRTDPASADDPLCPQGNRPVAGGSFSSIFTMAQRPAPTSTELQNPATRPFTLDPWRAAPFEVGDYVTVRGPIVKDGDSQYISAYAIDANVGIFTAPGTTPAYVSVDVVLMGTGPLNDPTIAQEGAKRARVEGFTTDSGPASTIRISAVDVNACTGEALDRLWNIEAVDPGAPNGAVAGRWRFAPAAPLFDLKGYPFLPPTREVHAVSNNGVVTTMNGLRAGEYTSPNQEFILPENRGIGTPVVAANFDAMPFLVQGSGPRGSSGYTGQLSPWPGPTPPARNACALVGPDQSVASSTRVSLDGSESVAANLPTGEVRYSWRQVDGTTLPLTDADKPVASFVAPTLAVGAPAVTLKHKLTVTPVAGGTPVESREVATTVTAPADTVAPVFGTLTAPSTIRKGTPTTLKVVVTDNVAVTSVTFFYTLNGQKGTAVATKSTTAANTWQAPVTFNATGKFSINATASDAAGNPANSTTVYTTVTQ